MITPAGFGQDQDEGLYYMWTMKIRNKGVKPLYPESSSAVTGSRRVDKPSHTLSLEKFPIYAFEELASQHPTWPDTTICRLNCTQKYCMCSNAVALSVLLEDSIYNSLII